MKPIFAIASLIALSCTPPALPAQDGSTANDTGAVTQLIEMLHDNHAITDAQYAVLAKSLGQVPQQGHPAQATQQVPQPRRAQQIHNTPTTTASPYPLPQIYGYLQMDAPLAVGQSNRMGSQTNFRRFYLFLHDAIAPHWMYQTSFGYNAGDPYVNDFYFGYNGVKHVVFMGGYYKGPFTLSDKTAPDDTPLPEYPLPISTLIPRKAIGVTVTTFRPRWSLTTGIFGGGYKEKAEPGTSGRWGSSTRGVWLAWIRNRDFWEVGASFAAREADSTHTVRLASRPESFVVGLNPVDTGTLTHVNGYWVAGVETLLRAGPFDIQAEYLRDHLQRDGLKALSFQGGYMQTSWSLTGEHRAFSVAQGKLGRLIAARPLSAGGPGAWELVARYSVTDLNATEIEGGLERNISIGVNWYPERPVKFMFNVIRILPVQGGAQSSLSATIAMLRGQAEFGR